MTTMLPAMVSTPGLPTKILDLLPHLPHAITPRYFQPTNADTQLPYAPQNPFNTGINTGWNTGWNTGREPLNPLLYWVDTPQPTSLPYGQGSSTSFEAANSVLDKISAKQYPSLHENGKNTALKDVSKEALLEFQFTNQDELTPAEQHALSYLILNFDKFSSKTMVFSGYSTQSSYVISLINDVNQNGLLDDGDSTNSVNGFGSSQLFEREFGPNPYQNPYYLPFLRSIGL
ncbi:MAG: hypothetical protein KC476_08950 [Cyanobacteria bacterium HKST-UBA06]|nr:hypothetical protein [Cyanobacteria bacterium HKST-UBA06]